MFDPIDNEKEIIIEFDSDRQIKRFEFFPISDAEITSEKLNEISQFFSQPYLLYFTLIISNFEHAKFEIKNLTLEFLRQLKDGDPERIASILDECLLTHTSITQASEDGVLEKRYGVKTHFSDGQEHYQVPVYTVNNESVFHSAIVAATLLHEFGLEYKFPQRATNEIDNIFIPTVAFLERLLTGIQAPNVLLELKEKSTRVLSTQTLITIIQPLFEADFIRREGHKVTVSNKNIIERKEKTLLKTFLLEVIGDKDEIVVSYADIWAQLFERYYTFPGAKASKQNIAIAVTKYLRNLQKSSNISVETFWQKSTEEDLGHFGLPNRYKLTKRGEEFLTRIKNLLENPREYLGHSSSYYIFNGKSLKRLNELDPQYQVLIVKLLRQLFC